MPGTAGLILFAHGSRDPAWRVPFEALLDELRAIDPDRPVALAFLELMAPALPQAIDTMVAAGVEHIRVAPIFLAPGKHTRSDLPALLDDARRRHPALTLASDATMLESPALRSVLARRIAAP